MPRKRSVKTIVESSRNKKAPAKQATSVAGTRKQIKQQLADLLKHFTQVEIAQQVGLHQPQVSLLWNGKPVFSDESRYGEVLEALQQLDTSSRAEPELDKADVQEIEEQMEAPSYTKWLTERMAVLGVDASQLSNKSKVALPVLNRILSGGTSNPQQATRTRLDRALEHFKQKRVKEGQKVADTKEVGYTDRLYVGFEFVRAQVELVPANAIGVYAIHDRRGFPLYIGSGEIKNRLRSHLDHADYARPKNASKFSYYIMSGVKMNGGMLSEMHPRAQADELERVLIKFAGNAVSHNIQHRTDLSEWG